MTSDNVTSTGDRRRSGDLATNPELWQALDNGKLMRAILTDFYETVFDDPKLAPFFDGVSKEWVIGKQYSFLMSIFTGEKSYFGERPRNAHHSMVISDELFDHRERLFEDCLRRFKLEEVHIQSWLAVHEVFRKQIVKDKPVPKKIRGVALPLEGYEAITLSVGTLCDSCESPVAEGAEVKYHVRTGRTYCQKCTPGASQPPPRPQ